MVRLSSRKARANNSWCNWHLVYPVHILSGVFFATVRHSAGNKLSDTGVILGLTGIRTSLITAVACTILVLSACSEGPESPATGANINRQAYEAVEQFSPTILDSDLPERIDLRPYCPTPREQGKQASCVGWATSYASRTILRAIVTELPPDSIAFSPAFIYNQVKSSDCFSGALISEGLTLLADSGSITLSDFPYVEAYCDRLPTGLERTRARNFRIQGFARLSGNRSFQVDLLAIKQHLAQKRPVVIAMPVGGSFTDHSGEALWEPTQEDSDLLSRFREGKRGEGELSGHAMTLVGYDDNLYGGSMLLMNSWGKDFGENGFCWIRYTDFLNWCMEAYGIYPRPDERRNQHLLSVSVGIRTSRKQYLPFGSYGARDFISRDILPPGEKFKLEISNSLPAYLYVFGRLADGGYEKIFPLDTTQTPYIGITGTRLLPVDYSYTLDNAGRSDEMLVILCDSLLNAEELARELGFPDSDPRKVVQQFAGRPLTALDTEGVKEGDNRIISLQAELEGLLLPIRLVIRKR